MATVQTTLRLDAEAKNQFEKIVNQLGMTASTAYNLFVRATIQRQGLPFDLVIDPLSDPEVKARVDAELDRRLAQANNPEATWYTMDEVMERLKSSK